MGLRQQPFNSPVVNIPMSKCLHFRTTTSIGNPEGRSIFKAAYTSFFMRRKLQDIEAVGIDRDMSGFPVIRVPGEMLDPDASAEVQANLQGYTQFLKDVRVDNNAGLILPSTRDEHGQLHFDFELLASPGTKAIKTDEIITRYGKDFARSLLADFLYLGDSGGGSLALGVSKIKAFIASIEHFAFIIRGQINDRLIPMILRANGLDVGSNMPFMTISDMDEHDLKDMAAYIKSLADVGYNLADDDRLEADLRLYANLPPPERTDTNAVGDYETQEALPLETADTRIAPGNNVVDMQPFLRGFRDAS